MSLCQWSLRPTLLFAALLCSPFSLLEAGEPSGSRLATSKPDDSETHFALSLLSDAERYRESTHAMILVDTSASQAGLVRDHALGICDTMLRSVVDNEKIGLMACDVSPVSLSDGIHSSGSTELTAALDKLKKRLPLGTTDLPTALLSAADEVGEDGVIVFIGDGFSFTNTPDADDFGEIIESFRERRISVMSYAIGPNCNVEFLAALANQTGGRVWVHENLESSNDQVARDLLAAARVDVIWPEAIEFSEGVATSYPKDVPPVRHDRDIILVGTLEEATEIVDVSLTGLVGDETVSLRWSAVTEEPSLDFAFLPAVVEMAKADDGLTLPSVNSDALREIGQILALTANDLVRNGKFALQRGDKKAALKIAKEAVKKDPTNSEAQSLLKAASSDSDDVSNINHRAFHYVQFGGVAGQSGFDELANGGDLLSDVETQRRLSSQRLETEIRSELRRSAETVLSNPDEAIAGLKGALEELRRSPDLDPSVRSRLSSLVSSALQSAAARREVVFERVAQRQRIEAQAAEGRRLVDEANRKEYAVQQLIERFNALIDQGLFFEANNDIAPVVNEEVRGTVISESLELRSNMLSNFELLEDVINERRRAFVDSLALNEAALVPFVDDPPVVYPPPEVWRALSARRERYASVDLAGSNDAERNIFNSLTERVLVDYSGDALSRVLEDFGTTLGIPIVIDEEELLNADVSSSETITLAVGEVSLRSALRLILDPLELTYVIENEVMKITTKSNADSAVTRIFPVGDLVVPIQSGGGGLGGGGFGGGGFGGGGLGGGGLGGGGFGGGGRGGFGGGGFGGGGRGGFGGGAFAVTDEPRKSADTSEQKNSLDQVIELLDEIDNSDAAESDSTEDAEELVKKAEQRIAKIVKSELTDAQKLVVADQMQSAQEHFSTIVSIIETSMQRGHAFPWSYEALSLSMQALDYPSHEVYRALMSAVDFSGDVSDAMKVARYLESREMHTEALTVLRDVTQKAPALSEPLEMALNIALREQNYEAMQWAATGVLSQGWTDDKLQLIEKARLASRAVFVKLNSDGRVVQASAFQSQVKLALKRDLVVRVSWTGEADVDISVEEPAGTVCSVTNPRTTSGGMLLGDGNSFQKPGIDGFSETYVCPKGYDGEYRILVSKAWGEVSTGKVTVEVLSDFGSNNERYVKQQVPLGEKSAMIKVAVVEGHREIPIVASTLARIEEEKLAVAKSVISQSGYGSRYGGSSSDSGSQFDSAQPLAGSQFPNGFNQGRVVGFSPDVQLLPEGTSLNATSVISGDRRYVRVAPIPSFTAITDVSTFNFIDGTGGGAGGGAGGGGGFGGGNFGGGGFGGGGAF